jgi:hypothetical protein
MKKPGSKNPNYEAILQEARDAQEGGCPTCRTPLLPGNSQLAHAIMRADWAANPRFTPSNRNNRRYGYKVPVCKVKISCLDTYSDKTIKANITPQEGAFYCDTCARKATVTNGDTSKHTHRQGKKRKIMHPPHPQSIKKFFRPSGGGGSSGIC